MESVLIVGAGPVGLVMAAELARHGVACRIIDKQEAPSIYCRALGITPRTLEVWEDMGIANAAINAGVFLKGRHVKINGGPAQSSFDDLSDLPYASWCLPQNETERILTKHLKTFGIEIERGIAVSHIVQHEKSVSVTFDKNGMYTDEKFRYVIGCDGAHSIVRRQAEIAFEGELLPYDFMLADVHIDWSLSPGIVFEAIHPVKDSAPDFFLAVPLPQPNRYRVSMLAFPQMEINGAGTDHGIQSELPAPELQHFQSVANRLVQEPVQLSDMRWSSLFRISMRVANRYREGNIFIAGDAAHIHPPTGGQGMNTGIQDAYNLAWKMALVIKGIAHETLLDSYNAERREEGVKVVERTLRASIKQDSRGFASGRLDDTQVLVTYRGIYAEKKGVAENEPGNFLTTGDRAPDCNGLRRQGVGFATRLFEMLRGTEYVLLVDAGNNEQQVLNALYDFLKTLKQVFGENFSSYVRIIAIGKNSDSISSTPGIVYLQDPENAFITTYNARAGAAWLIRPDGYIGWMDENWQNAGLHTYLKNVFCTNQSNGLKQ